MNNFNKPFSRKGTSCIKWDNIKNMTGKDNVLPFWIADSDYQTAKPIIDSLEKRVKHGAFGYTMADDEYYDVIRKWIERRYHYEVNKEDIIPTSGIVSSLFYLILSLKDDSKGVIVQTPVYNPFYDIIKGNGLEIVQNPLINNNEKYSMDLDDLEKKMVEGNKIMILCNPHNPVGRCYTKEELENVVHLCKKYGVYLLSDEIHCDIILKGHSFTSAMAFYNQYNNIVTLFAPSKTFNLAGLMGSNVIIKNKKMNEKFRKVISTYHYGTPNLLSLTATKTAYTSCDAWVDNQQKHITKNFKILKEYFKENMPLVKVTNLEATYLVWLDFRYLHLDCEKLSKGLLEEGILVNKGSVYCEKYEGFIRYNIACSQDEMLKGLEDINKFVKKVTK